MDVRQRGDDFEEALRSALEAHQAKMWTALPGKIVGYDAAKQRVQVQVSIKSFVKQEDGSQKAVDLPVLQDVPVQFPGGGGQTMTFPVKEGDETLVVFSSRSPDSWQQSGGDQVAVDASMHSLSGGFAMMGFRNDTRALPDVSSSETQIRSDDGKTKIGLSGTGGVSIDTDKSVGISAASGVNITGGAGDVNFSGTLNVTGEIVLNGISLSTHKHGDVQPGSGSTGTPTN